ncbi:MAG: hypothetical protein QW559_00650 [Candidatus Woesearchaeota archaeon]
MKRKVIQIANSSKLVSLPKEWCEKNNIKKGDELDLLIDSNTIRIFASALPKVERVEIKVSDYGKKITSIIYALYKKGVDEIKIIVDSPGVSEDIAALISKAMIGYEIVEQSAHQYVIKNVSGHIEGFEQMLRRIFTLLLSMADEGYKSLRDKAFRNFSELIALEEANNRFSVACRRILNKGYPINYPLIGPIYNLIDLLENIADGYKYLYKDLEKMKDYEPSLEVLEYFKEINSSLRGHYNLFYNFDPKLVEESLLKKEKVIKNGLELLKKKKKKTEIVIIHHLHMLAHQIFDALGPILILKIPSSQYQS